MFIKTTIRQAISAAVSPATKFAIVVRDDIKMTKGKTAAQCAHASVLCFQMLQELQKKRRILNAWCFAGQPKIVLRATGYESILGIQAQADALGVVTVIVKDAGRTQLEPGTVTVLGVGPDNVETIDKLVAHLKLL